MLYYEKYRILTHKPNLYDSLDDEEFDDEEELNKIYLDLILYLILYYLYLISSLYFIFLFI